MYEKNTRWDRVNHNLKQKIFISDAKNVKKSSQQSWQCTLVIDIILKVEQYMPTLRVVNK